jgi:hypothetical protein
VLDHAVDITPECIESTEKKLAELDALADELAGGQRRNDGMKPT